jgi:hypothetical protein
MMTVSLEMLILGNPNADSVDGFIVMQVLIVSLSSNAYCQGSILISYIIAVGYNIIRTHWWMNDTYRYVRYNVFYMFCFGVMYFFSHRINSRERHRFEQERKQKHMLNLFNNLVKAFHDGIIITEMDNIVYKNKQIQSLLEIKLNCFASSH